MGKPKDDAERASEQIGFRITVGEKAAAEEMARRRRTETGDASLSGWFRALVRREARSAGIAVDDAPAPKPAAPARRAAPPKKAARR